MSVAIVVVRAVVVVVVVVVVVEEEEEEQVPGEGAHATARGESELNRHAGLSSSLHHLHLDSVTDGVIVTAASCSGDALCPWIAICA